jgi:hypothetical protein
VQAHSRKPGSMEVCGWTCLCCSTLIFSAPYLLACLESAMDAHLFLEGLQDAKQHMDN